MLRLWFDKCQNRHSLIASSIQYSSREVNGISKFKLIPNPKVNFFLSILEGYDGDIRGLMYLSLDMKIPNRIDACCNLHENVMDLNQNNVVILFRQLTVEMTGRS